MSLAPFQQRVVDEKTELDAKIAKLYPFMETTIFAALPIEEQDRLSRQFVVMEEYSRILGERITAFKVA